MVQIPSRWVTLHEVISRDDGTTDVNALTALCLAFKDGRVDHRGVMLIDAAGQRFFPKLRRLYPYAFPLPKQLLVSEEVADNLRHEWNSRGPCCADPINGANPPSRSLLQLTAAPAARIRGEIGRAYERAKAHGLKAPNLLEVSRIVQLALEQKGFRTSLRQVQKLAAVDEFKACRLPPGKRWSSRTK
jgi:hypothetical protein